MKNQLFLCRFCQSAVSVIAYATCYLHGAFAEQYQYPPSDLGAKSPADLKHYEEVAVIGGIDKLVQIDLWNLLQKNGIDSFCEGSLWHSLSVPRSQKEAASKIIASETKRGLFDTWYKHNDFKDISKDDLIYSDEMKERPAIIDELFKCKEIQSEFKGYTYVKILYAKKKLIWVTSDKQAIGYDGSITLLPDKNSKSGCRVEFQILDNGRYGWFMGGGSWNPNMH